MTIQDLEQMIGKSVWSKEPYNDNILHEGVVISAIIEGPGDYSINVDFDYIIWENFPLQEFSKTVFWELNEKYGIDINGKKVKGGNHVN